MMNIGIFSLIIHRICMLSIPFTQAPMNRSSALGISLANTSSFLQTQSLRCLFAHSIHAAFSFSCLCMEVMASMAAPYQQMFLSWVTSTEEGLEGLSSQNSGCTSFIASPFFISEFSQSFHCSRLEMSVGSIRPEWMVGAGSSSHLAWMGSNSVYTSGEAYSGSLRMIRVHHRCPSN